LNIRYIAMIKIIQKSSSKKHFMASLYDKIQESLAFLRMTTDFQPKYGLILGTGLGSLADEIVRVSTIKYEDIPHFPISTVVSHQGELIFGYLEKIPIVAMSGRFHYYEGYSMQEVTFPVRVLKFLGIEQLFISNAAGSMNPHILGGDLVFIKDHINLQPENPLRGVNDERIGPRFPDMLHTYNAKLNDQAMKIANEKGIRAHTGIYVGLQGPNLETPAEYAFMNRIGGDVVGMSTVPEVLVARHMSLPVFVLSVVSNQSYPKEVMREVTVEEIIALVNAVAPKAAWIVKELLLFCEQGNSMDN
jgi:purine-nucleoside phosphorylase